MVVPTSTQTVGRAEDGEGQSQSQGAGGGGGQGMKGLRIKKIKKGHS